jgi:hypothetical protein
MLHIFSDETLSDIYEDIIRTVQPGDVTSNLQLPVTPRKNNPYSVVVNGNFEISKTMGRDVNMKIFDYVGKITAYSIVNENEDEMTPKDCQLKTEPCTLKFDKLQVFIYSNLISNYILTYTHVHNF